MTDPLADPRAADLLAAVPADVIALASAFHTAAQEASMTATGLLAARDDGVWTGHAADSFRHAIGHVPAELTHIRAGYSAVATALSDYEVTVSLVQTQFVKVVGELNDMHAQIGTATTATTQAQAGMAPAHATSLDQLRQAELAVARARSTLEEYHAEAAQLRGRAFTLLDEFDAARSLCRATVAAAQRTAPARPQSGEGRHVAAAAGRLSRVDGAAFGMTPLGGPVPIAPPAEERKRIEAMIRQADGLLGTPYVYGGGHSGGGATGGGLDCSGFVSAVLRSGGYHQRGGDDRGLCQPAGHRLGPGSLRDHL